MLSRNNATFFYMSDYTGETKGIRAFLPQHIEFTTDILRNKIGDEKIMQIN